MNLADIIGRGAKKIKRKPILLIGNDPFLSKRDKEENERVTFMVKKAEAINNEVEKMKDAYWDEVTNYVLGEGFVEGGDPNLMIEDGVLFLIEEDE